MVNLCAYASTVESLGLFCDLATTTDHVNAIVAVLSGQYIQLNQLSHSSMH